VHGHAGVMAGVRVRVIGTHNAALREQADREHDARDERIEPADHIRYLAYG
jgi:hypothetical protein